MIVQFSRRAVLSAARAVAVTAAVLGPLAVAAGPAMAQTKSEVAPPQVGAASAAERPYRVFMILGRGETEVEQGFRDYFRDKGIALDITVRNIENDPANVPGFVAEAKRLRPDLVYTWGTPAALGTVGTYDAVDPAKHITDIPVVFTLVTAPVGAKVAPSWDSSGRNVTGASHVVPLESQINAMRAYRDFTKIAAIFNPKERNSVLQIEGLRELSKERGFELIESPVPLDAEGNPDASTLPALVAQVAALKPQILYLGPDTFVAGVNREVVTQAAVQHGIPTFSATERPLRDAEALFGLVTRYYNLGRLTAYKAEQILVDKVHPRDIPIETLTRFTYIVKMDVARRLGLYPPMSVLSFAEIID